MAEEEIALEATEYGRLCPITARYMELREAGNIEYARLNVAEATGATPAQVFARLGPRFNEILAQEAADWNARFGAGANGQAPAGAWSGVKALCFALFMAVLLTGALLLLPPVRRRASREVAEFRHLAHSKAARNEALEGLLFASPWLLGLCLFTAFPILFSIVLSFCQWDPYDAIAKMKFIGLDNFRRAFSTDPVTGDPLAFKSLYNTFYYAVFAVPLSLCTSLGLALLLNQKFRGISVFRTTFYLPSIVSGVATVVLWYFIFNPVFGPLNTFLRAANRFLDATVIFAFIDLPVPFWMGDPAWTKPAMIIMALWAAGGAGMLVFLAGLQGVPDQLYEAAEIDGAGRFRKFWNVTLPMLTPTIYFNLIMGVIGALKVFMQAYVMTDGLGGVDQSLLFFVLHLYNKAFVSFEMGYASALAWILFSIILAFTLLIIRSSSAWVYYEGERRSR